MSTPPFAIVSAPLISDPDPIVKPPGNTMGVLDCTNPWNGPFAPTDITPPPKSLGAGALPRKKPWAQLKFLGTASRKDAPVTKLPTPAATADPAAVAAVASSAGAKPPPLTTMAAKPTIAPSHFLRLNVP